MAQALERLAQNLFLAAATPAQHAALAAFSPATLDEIENRKAELRARRDFLLSALRERGFDIPLTPQGAFYLYADCSRLTADSHAFANLLLEQTGIAATPGVDFGSHRAARHIRFAYTQPLPRLADAMTRLADASEAARRRIEDMTPGINSVEEAFRRLGVTSKAEMDRAAAEAKQAFEVIRDSGKATAEELRAAFTAYAEQAVAANGGVADATVKAQASALGLAVEVDKTGKVIVQSMAEAAFGVKGAGQALEDAADSARELGEAAGEAGESMVEAARAQNAAVKSVTVSLVDATTAQSRYADEAKRVASAVYNSALDQANSFRASAGAIDGARAAARLYIEEMERLDARQQEFSSNAAEGVEQLRLRLLELNGTEEQIARARQSRDQAEVLRTIELTRLDLRRAELRKNQGEVQRLQTEINLLQEQLTLIDQIYRAEARQRTNASSTPRGSSSGSSSGVSAGGAGVQAAAPSQTFGAKQTTLNINLPGSGIFSGDRASLEAFARQLGPVITDLQRKGAL